MFTKGMIRAIVLIVASVAIACTPEPNANRVRHPVVVVGVDGAEWRLINRLWAEGRLPHLRSLADRGVTAPIETFHKESPVIWTSIATGVYPDVHGITGFRVRAEDGDRPVTSTVRRVPAIWNIVSTVGLRVAVLGWWATWPAEDVNGVVVSDRTHRDLDRGVSPSEFVPRFEEISQTALAEPHIFGGNPAIAAHDQVLARTAVALAADRFDLLMVYFRGVDIASHYNWKYVEPQKFGDFQQDQIDAGWERIATVYEAVDDIIGALERAVPGEVNLFVLSDHGFRAKRSEILRVLLNLNSVLQRLGFLKRNDDDGVDFSRSQFYTSETTSDYLVNKLRFCLRQREPGGRVRPEDRRSLRRRLERALDRVTYANGSPALRARDATAEERQSGADLIVEVLTEGAEKPLLVNGRPHYGALTEVSRISGGHGPRTRGVFFAAGPDIDPASSLELMDVIDTAPTLLYALGLPVADDFAGRARVELFTAGFRDHHKLESIPTWGMKRDGHSLSSVVDEEILRELRALGYLDD